MHIKRSSANPIITPQLDPSIGTNINGPSLIRVPGWLPDPLGCYYLYFAHHQGSHIRLAYADDLAGPWRIHVPGTLQLDQTPCVRHVASPDVHIDTTNRRLAMYYHGPVDSVPSTGDSAGWGVGQRSFVATSRDGLHFTSQKEILGPSYFRVFAWRGWKVAMAMPGIFLRSADGFSDFQQGPTLFNRNMRHAALLRRDQTLYVFYSTVGDAPEHILLSRIELTPDWMEWTASPPQTVLSPEVDYEGVKLPIAPSVRGAIHEPAHQLRDPAIYVEESELGEKIYLLYSIAGEGGLALAEIEA